MKFLVNEVQFKKVISKIQSEMETYLLNEGVNEDRALKILKDSKIENAEEILNFLKNKDKSKNHKVLPALTLFYTNAQNYTQFEDIIKTFDKIFKEKTIPDITVDGSRVKILGNEFDDNDFAGFQNFVEHYYFEKQKGDYEEMEKLYDVNANKIFENDNFEVYYAASEQVCIKLFGRDNEDRIFIKRSYCLGWQKPKSGEPEDYYSNYRDPSGSQKKTFYVVVDKNLYQKYLRTGEDNPSLINVVSVKDDFDQTGKFFVWDRNNVQDGDKVEGYSSVEEYMKHLEDGGVNLSIFKPKTYKTEFTKPIRNMAANPGSDSLFVSLSPQEKDTYVSKFAVTLTQFQMNFMLKKMPLSSITNFAKNDGKIKDLSSEVFNLMNQNLQKSFLRSKLKQLTNDSKNFNFDNFFNYMTNNININFAIAFIKDSFTNEINPNKNIEESKKVLSLLSPKEFFESLVNDSFIRINNENFKTDTLPTNLGEYLKNATHIEIEDLDKIKNIPDSISEAKNLKHLEIKNCSNLTSLPDSITEISTLEFLGLQNNDSLTSLPESIGNLTNLDHLALQGNDKITELPKSIGNLRNLIVINLEGVLLQSLPIKELNSLPDLLHITYDRGTLTNLSDEEKEFIVNFGQ